MNRSLFLLVLILIAVVAPVSSAICYGPDYGNTTQKNATLVNETPISKTHLYTYDPVAATESNLPKFRWNKTLGKEPISISYVYVELSNKTKFDLIPPTVDAKYTFTDGATTVATVKAYLTKVYDDPINSKQYGTLTFDFQYVNLPYLNALGADYISGFGTVNYDNITSASGYYDKIYGNTTSKDISDYFGYSIVLDVLPYDIYSTDYVISLYRGNFQNDYGIVNIADGSSYSKFITILRNVGKIGNSRLQYWNEFNQIMYDSGEVATNNTYYFAVTTGRWTINSSITGDNWEIFNETYNCTVVVPPGVSSDIVVVTRDCSLNTLLNGVNVSYFDIWDTSWAGWGYTGVSYPGRVDFVSQPISEFNITAEAIGFTTGYANVTNTALGVSTSICMYPDVGYSTLEFYVTDNSTGYGPSGIPVKIRTGVTDYGKMTVSGFARFNTTDGLSYMWSVAQGIGDCDSTHASQCYMPVSGNVTATTGPTRINVVLSTYGEAGGGAGGGGNVSPHEAAENVMDVIYSLLPSLLMLVFLMLFMGVLGYTPGRRRR